jgi:hypothetical protein
MMHCLQVGVSRVWAEVEEEERRSESVMETVVVEKCIFLNVCERLG